MEGERPEVLRDPLRLNLTDISYPPTRPTSVPNDDPFDSDTPQEEDVLTRAQRPYFAARGGDDNVRTFSQASLLSSLRSKSTSSTDYGEFDVDDDEARLTSFASGTAGHGHDRSAMSLSVSTHLDPSMASGIDVERTPKSRASKSQSKRYSTSPSPASRLRSVSRNLRRVSLRVVNLAGVGLEEKARGIRLPDDKDDGAKVKGKDTQSAVSGEDQEEEHELPDLATRLPIRGRTLGFLGPSNRIRLAMFRFLTYPYVHFILYA